jgi:hypothetical protein
MNAAVRPVSVATAAVNPSTRLSTAISDARGSAVPNVATSASTP